mmetsp:Transcript_23836/g.21687  ORF Transcript_23836/g.21687 Transcript_23836/m.21687 type:complete len:80 (+) Transcript_23836:161-400(+)
MPTLLLIKSKDSEEVFDYFVMKYIEIIIDNHGSLVRPIRHNNICIDWVDPTFSEQFLRFKKLDLRRLYNLMNFDDFIKL